MNPIAKIIDVRDRLSTMLQTENETAQNHVKEQLDSLINQLTEAIRELSGEVNFQTNMVQELQRTTRTPLKPPGEDGPHPVKCGF
jgi:hypothetical protein